MFRVVGDVIPVIPALRVIRICRIALGLFLAHERPLLVELDFAV